MQNNNNGNGLQVVTRPTEQVNPITYNSQEVRKLLDAALNSPELFAVLNNDFVPCYSKDGEKSKRYFAVFTQQYTVKQVEETAKVERPVLKLVERKVLAKIPKDGSLNGLEVLDVKAGTYVQKVEKEFKAWKGQKVAPIVNLIPTNRTLAVVFEAAENLTLRQFAVLAINTLALICENAEVNGKPIPVRKTAGINLSFNFEKRAISTAKLGEGIRAALLTSDLQKFTSLMLRKLEMCEKVNGKPEVKPGLASLLK